MNHDTLQAIQCHACGSIYSLEYLTPSKRHTIAFKWLDEHCKTKHNISLAEKRTARLIENQMKNVHRVIN